MCYVTPPLHHPFFFVSPVTVHISGWVRVGWKSCVFLSLPSLGTLSLIFLLRFCHFRPLLWALNSRRLLYFNHIFFEFSLVVVMVVWLSWFSSLTISMPYILQ
jgi:hypothetical protein